MISILKIYNQELIKDYLTNVQQQQKTYRKFHEFILTVFL